MLNAAKSADEIEKLLSCEVDDISQAKDEPAERSSAVGPAQRRSGTHHNGIREGIQVVDSEYMVNGTRMFNYHWLSHAPRDQAPALCMIDFVLALPMMQVRMGASKAQPKSMLISVGVELAIPIAVAIKQLRAFGALHAIPLDINPPIAQFVNGA